MNAPRIRLSRFTADRTPTIDGNGSTPKVRLRVAAGRTDRPDEQGSGGFRRLLAPLPATGIVLVLIALVGYWAVYAAGGKRTQVLVAARALPAGTVLNASDLRTGRLGGDASLLSTLLSADQRSQVIGQRLSTAVPAGAPLPVGALAGRQASASAFTLSVPEFDLATGLQAGDRVTVLATFGAGSGQAVTRPIARNLEVLAVGEPAANADPSTTTVPIALAVSEPSEASRLALANDDAKIDLLLEGSGASTAAIPQAAQGSAP